jgi:hypothetical protein
MLTVNVAMNDDAMEPMVLVAGRAAPARLLQREMPEVAKHAERVKTAPDRRKAWVADTVLVWSEVRSGHPLHLSLHCVSRCGVNQVEVRLVF